jgi:hypothetical protein
LKKFRDFAKTWLEGNCSPKSQAIQKEAYNNKSGVKRDSGPTTDPENRDR